MQLFRLKSILTVLLAVFNSNIYSQPLTIDQSFSVNYNFDTGKHMFGILEVSNGVFFCYGEFATFSNLDFRNGIMFNNNGTVLSNFYITPSTNNVISYATKTINNNLLIQSPGEGFRIVDFNGIDVNATYQSNITSFLPTSVTFTSSESFYSTSHYLISGCNPSPCYYPASNPTTSFYLYRLKPDGLLDTTFNHDTNGPILYVKSFNDSTIFISGSYTTYDSIYSTNLVKTNINGDLDTSFKSKFVWGGIYPAYLQNDGKLIVTGKFLIQGISDTLGIIRVLENGEIDTTFNNSAAIISSNTGLGYFTTLHSVCKTSDNGFLIGGRFSEYDGVPRGSIVKTDENGFIDMAYLNGTGFDSHPFPVLGIPPTVNNILHGSDNKYYITGWFNGFNGQPTQPIIRLNGLQTGDPEIPTNNSIMVYPNPILNLLNISINNDALLKNTHLILFDTYGNLITKYQINQKHFELDLSTISNGIYYISIINDLISHKQVIIKKN